MGGNKFWLLKISIFLFVVGLVLRLYQPSFAYDQLITHPALTAEIARFFNLKNNNSSFLVDSQEIEWLKKGAVEEDEPARWINHFYDPVHNVGWSGKHYGYLSEEEGYSRGGDLAPMHSLPSVEWATNQQYQSAYGRQYGNQTWQKALKAYVDGDKKTAFIALGHILHLIEDASVPDHTRDDSHPGIEGDPGSPYEESSKEFVQNNALTVANSLAANKQDVPNWDTLQSAFKSIATYSNANFFSEDTIIGSDFSSPEIKNAALQTMKVGDANYVYLYLNQIYLSKVNIIGRETRITTDDNNYVMPSYRNHLFPKVVQTGAGVIQLFFKQGEYYKQHPEQLETIAPDSNTKLLTALAQAPTRQLIKTCGLIGESVCQNAESSLEPIKVKLGLAYPVAPVTIPLSSLQNLATEAPIIYGPPIPANLATVKSAPKTVLGEKIFNTDVLTDAAPQQNAAPQNSQPQTPSVPAAIVVAPTKHIYSSEGGGGASIANPFIEPLAALPSHQSLNVVTSTNNDAANNVSATSPESSAPPAKDVTPPLAPIVDSAFSTIIFTTSSSVVIFGVASTDTVKLGYYVSLVGVASATTPAPAWEGGDLLNWQYNTPLTPGYNYLYFSAIDDAGNTSSLSRVVTVVRDNEAPPVPKIIATVASTTVSVVLDSTDALSPVTLFDVEFATSSGPVTSSAVVWRSLFTQSSSTSFTISGQQNVNYYFRARARDGVGNVSNWSNTPNNTFINWSGEVVINEVAWAGTASNHTNDEWFELYNTTNAPIDVKNWQFKASGRLISVVKNVNTIIAPHGYLLFESNYDRVVDDIPADVIYNLNGSFNDKGEKLELFKPNGEKADEVDCSKGWFAGDAVKYKTMERISPQAPGGDPANWQSNQSFRLQGIPFGGGTLNGSARQPNFGFIPLSGTQTENVRTLTKNNNPYLLSFYTIPAGLKLIIEPGVVVKSYYTNSSIEVRGTLETQGTSDSNVVFTSGRDHSFNDAILDTIVGSWATNTPQAKDWQGLWLYAKAQANLNGLSMRYAGKDFRVNNYIYTGFTSQAIRSESATLNINNSQFTNNGSTFIRAETATTSIVNSVFSGGDIAVDSYGNDLTISNSSFSNFAGSQGPLMIRYYWPKLEANVLSSNTFNMPYFSSVTITTSSVLSRGSSIAFDYLAVNPNSVLSIEPGVHMYAASFGVLDVRGNVEAHGTADEPIVISPIDKNLWGNVVFNSSTSHLEYVSLVGGNLTSPYVVTNDGMVVANNSTLNLNHCTISDMREGTNNLVQISKSNVVIKDSAIGQTVKGVKYSSTGIKENSGTLLLDNVRLFNLTYGLYQGNSNGLLPPVFMFNNMLPSNFVNVDTLWTPPGWFAWPVVSTST